MKMEKFGMKSCPWTKSPSLKRKFPFAKNSQIFNSKILTNCRDPKELEKTWFYTFVSQKTKILNQYHTKDLQKSPLQRSNLRPYKRPLYYLLLINQNYSPKRVRDPAI